MRKILFLLVILCPVIHYGQEGIVVDSTKIFKNLDEALENPSVVFHLKLNKKKLETIPESIFLLENLVTLDLSKNKLTTVPQEIASLKKLRDLKLNKNKFTQFPVAICKLDSLQVLGLNQNSIVEIPPEIGKLKELVYLDMWSNDLDVFPDELEQLEKLKEFDLRVIQLTDNQQKQINFLLPKAKVHMSNNCNCAK